MEGRCTDNGHAGTQRQGIMTMTPHAYSPTPPGRVDAAPTADQFLFQDGAAFSFDFEGVQAARPRDGVVRSGTVRSARPPLKARLCRVTAVVVLSLAIGGGGLAFYLYPEPSGDNNSPVGISIMGAVDALFNPLADTPHAKPESAGSWARAAGDAAEAGRVVPVPVAVKQKDTRPAPAVRGSWDGIGCLTKVREQLQLVDSQHNGCQVALDLMADAKSVFSGFVPELADTGLSSHTVFQARISELEIKRKSLLAKFVPHSREVRAVDEEIAAVRDSFKECLSAQVAYLNQRKAYLTARKAELERELSPTARSQERRSVGPTAGNRVRETPRPVAAPNAPTALMNHLEKLGRRVPASAMERILGAVKPAFDGFPFSCTVSGPTEENLDTPDRSVNPVWALASSLVPSGCHERLRWERLSGAVGLLWE